MIVIPPVLDTTAIEIISNELLKHNEGEIHWMRNNYSKH